MIKPHYRVKRIQDLKRGDKILDLKQKRHLVVLLDAYQEGHQEGVPIWKIRYNHFLGRMPLNQVAWDMEDMQAWVFVS